MRPSSTARSMRVPEGSWRRNSRASRGLPTSPSWIHSPRCPELHPLPPLALVGAVFPCQDLSQAGGKTGIEGSKSGVVEHLFRLLEAGGEKPRWVLIENVSYMLRLDRGRGMAYLVDRLEARGYPWAYPVIDGGAFVFP